MPFHVLLTDSREKAWAFYKTVVKLTSTARGSAFSGRLAKIPGDSERWAVILYLISSRRETYDLIRENVPEGGIFSDYDGAGV